MSTQNSTTFPRVLGGNFSLFGAIFLLLSGLATQAFSSEAATCDDAATIAAREQNIPINVLKAVTRVETGRRINGELRPWPWTVNMEGEGHWFQTEDEARHYVFKHFKQGKRSFDVGCFQINYRWHGTAFRSIDEMFNPLENARYAAQFLNRLFDELGDWTDAVGAYHSRTPKHADRYTRKYKSVQAALLHNSNGSTRGTSVPAPPPQRINNFPLLQSADASGRNGSLVPTRTPSQTSLLTR